MLSLAIFTLPDSSVEISSSDGPIILQGPHHSAQKSTTTGPSASRTSLLKLLLSTLTVAMMKPFGVSRRTICGVWQATFKQRLCHASRESGKRAVERRVGERDQPGLLGEEQHGGDLPARIERLEQGAVERELQQIGRRNLRKLRRGRAVGLVVDDHHLVGGHRQPVDLARKRAACGPAPPPRP